jgi:hypothetical protein
MAKIESKFVYDGDTYNKVDSIKDIDIYINEQEYYVLLCDKQMNILKMIRAEAGQIGGYMKIENV